jgi:hypothetical protein
MASEMRDAGLAARCGVGKRRPKRKKKKQLGAEIETTDEIVMVVVAGQAGEFDGDADDASTVPPSSKEGSAQAFHRVRCASGERVAAADGRNPKR